MTLAWKKIVIDVKVLDSQLDYNILQGHNLMYTMDAFNSSLFHIMMFLHDGKVFTIDQLTYSLPRSKSSLDNVISTLQKVPLQNLKMDPNFSKIPLF